jgi:hypothetical protein
MVDRLKVAGHYAVSSLFQHYPERAEVYSYFVDRELDKTSVGGKTKLVTGRCKITSKIATESEELEYGVLHLGDHNISGGVRTFEPGREGIHRIEEIRNAFEKADLPGVYKLIEECFGKSTFSLRSLFRDEQRRVLDVILKAANADLEELNRQAFERTAPLMRFLMYLGLSLPPLFRNTATAVINAQLQNAFKTKDLDQDRILDELDTAKFWGIDLDAEGLAFVFSKTIESMALEFHSSPRDLHLLEKLNSAVKLALQLPFKINFYRTQNSYYDMLKSSYREQQEASARGDEQASAWTEKFKELGSMLSIKVE